jgi:hypothetical protein
VISPAGQRVVLDEASESLYVCVEFLGMSERSAGLASSEPWCCSRVPSLLVQCLANPASPLGFECVPRPHASLSADGADVLSRGVDRGVGPHAGCLGPTLHSLSREVRGLPDDGAGPALCVCHAAADGGTGAHCGLRGRLHDACFPLLI